MQVKALANTDTAAWPNEFVKVYVTNYLASLENEDCIGELNSQIVVIKAEDRKIDVEANTCSISIPDNIGYAQIANLPAKLKLYVSARVMLIDDVNISARLINDSVDAVQYLDMR